MEVLVMSEQGYSKYEIMVNVMKALKVSTFDLKDIEKQLKKLKAKPDGDGVYSVTVNKAVVDHFELEKQMERSDKSLISVLQKQNKSLISENKELRGQLIALTSMKSTVDRLASNFGNLNKHVTAMGQFIQQQLNDEIDETPTDSSASDDDSNGQQDSYSSNYYKNGVESPSQQA